MSSSVVTVIDYGMGNIWSVVSALEHLGCATCVTSDPKLVAKAGVLVLPGVGSFATAMTSLVRAGIDEAILEAVRTRESKIIGICLGMQLMGVSGTEDGETLGLGLIPAPVQRFTSEEVVGRKVPHVGFDEVHCNPRARLFRGIPELADFYFVHSYRMQLVEAAGLVTSCTYGSDFLAAYEDETVFATQFHPEKSQTNGLAVLKNFLGA